MTIDKSVIMATMNKERVIFMSVLISKCQKAHLVPADYDDKWVGK